MDIESKTPIACSSCAKAKAKCDRKQPCTRCVSKRRICQPRTARRSGNTSSQPNRPTEEVWDPSVIEYSNKLDTIAPWPIAPMIPTSMKGHSYSSTPGKVPSSAAGQIYKSSQPQISNIYPVSYNNQDVLHSVFARSPGNINDFLTPARQPFTQMEIDDVFGDKEMLSIEGIHDSLNFDIPLMPGFSLPIDRLPVRDNQSDVEVCHMSAIAISDPGRAFSSSLGAYGSEVESQSDRNSLDRSSQSPIMNTSRSRNSVPEHKGTFAAQDRWSYFQCNPPSYSSPVSKTVSIYLEGLENALESEAAWQRRNWQSQTIDELHCEPNVRVEPLSSYTRERLVEVTQGICQKAIDTHHIVPRSQPSAASMEGRGFITLPPPIVLECFLEAYVRRCESYYACVPAGLLESNEVIQGENAKASCLLLLLMIAQGAAATPNIEARSLSSGLMEACRISLHDFLEKDFDHAQNLMMLQCELLYTNLAAWSGDKWQMEIAIGQRGLYMSVLRSVGLLEFQHVRPSREDCRANPTNSWEKWKEQEGKTRLVVSWVFVDQELGLFLDQPPLLSLSCIRTTMPDSDALWEADSSGEWLKVRDRANGTPDKSRMSIRDLFRFFLDGELANPNVFLSSAQLRLLLHPMQSQVIHLQQILSCCPDGNGIRKAPQAMTKAKILTRLEEVQSLLGQWYTLASRCSRNESHPGPAMYANLIIYHLISLNTLCLIPEIEKIARFEGKMTQLQPLPPLKLDCAENAEQIFFHSGQIFRLLRLIPEDVRPSWWPAAVYRAALAAWMTSMIKAKTQSLLSNLGRDARQPFAIDAVTPEDPTLAQYLRTGEGQPMLSKKDGTVVSLEVPQDILTHWVELLSGKNTTRFQDGIRSKLVRLVERWKKWKVQ